MKKMKTLFSVKGVVLTLLAVCVIVVTAIILISVRTDSIRVRVEQQSMAYATETYIEPIVIETVPVTETVVSTEAPTKVDMTEASTKNISSEADTVSVSTDDDSDLDNKSEPEINHISFKDTSKDKPAAFGDAIAFNAYDYYGNWFPAEIIFNNIIWEDDDSKFVKSVISDLNDSGIWFPASHTKSNSKFAVVSFSVILSTEDTEGLTFKGNMKPNIEVYKNGSNLMSFQTVEERTKKYKPGDTVDMFGVFEYDGSKDLYFAFNFNDKNGYEVGYVKP